MTRKRRIYCISTVAALAIAAYAFCLPAQLFRAPLSAVLTASDGTLLGARTASDGQWRFPPSDSIPDKFAACIITCEDKRFRRHPGVDPLALGRAMMNNLTGHRRSGASTITMQTIRLSEGLGERSYARKIKEMILATRLELRCSKDEILAMYAANAPFGGNVVGIEAAAWRYWGRSADQLSWAENATLAVLPNAPSLIHPGKGRDRLLNKRNNLLARLLSEGIIDSDEYELAIEEPLPDKPLPLPNLAPHYLQTLRASNPDGLFRSGINPALQKRAQGILEGYAAQYGGNLVGSIAAIVLDVRSGEPVIYCGNVCSETADGAAVDAARARRSSGSTLKPLLYAAMLDSGTLLPTMLVADTPFHFKDFSPSNYSHSFDGAVTAESVIQRSLNVPSVRMLHEYGIAPFIDILQRCGFTTIDRGEETYGLSLILGGAEITLWDLVNSYRNMALRLKGGHEDCCPLSRGALWCTFEALKGVQRPEEESAWQNFSSSREIAWKTGTSYGNRDAWSIGVTPDYIIGVWVGNCNGEGRPMLTGVGYAAPVMFDLLGLLPRSPWFDCPYDSLREVEVCPDSGHPPSEICPHEQLETVLCPRSDNMPPQCPYHRMVHLSADGRYQVDSECYDPALIRSESWFVLPPAQQWYYRRNHSSYRELPPFHPSYKGGYGSSVLQIIYPQAGMKVLSPVAMDGVSRGVVFSAAHNDPSATLFWHLDSEYLGSTRTDHKISAVPSPGEHLLVITDTNANSASVRFNAE